MYQVLGMHKCTRQTEALAPSGFTTNIHNEDIRLETLVALVDAKCYGKKEARRRRAGKDVADGQAGPHRGADV